MANLSKLASPSSSCQEAWLTSASSDREALHAAVLAHSLRKTLTNRNIGIIIDNNNLSKDVR
jgi:hypothetical protein